MNKEDIIKWLQDIPEMPTADVDIFDFACSSDDACFQEGIFKSGKYLCGSSVKVILNFDKTTVVVGGCGSPYCSFCGNKKIQDVKDFFLQLSSINPDFLVSVVEYDYSKDKSLKDFLKKFDLDKSNYIAYPALRGYIVVFNRASVSDEFVHLKDAVEIINYDRLVKTKPPQKRKTGSLDKCQRTRHDFTGESYDDIESANAIDFYGVAGSYDGNNGGDFIEYTSYEIFIKSNRVIVEDVVDIVKRELDNVVGTKGLYVSDQDKYSILEYIKDRICVFLMVKRFEVEVRFLMVTSKIESGMIFINQNVEVV